MLRLNEDSGLAARYRAARCVFFDCDGVIFDSNGFKIDAMQHALSDRTPAEREAMLAYWRENGGLSRWVKFRHFFEHIVQESDVEAKVETACARFGDYSLAAYASREPVKEALALARDKGAERCYVVSGASQEELRTVFRQKRLEARFRAILGSPATKRELVEPMLAELGVEPWQALFIGDGAGDFRVCQALGIPFVYLDVFTEWPNAEAALRDAEGVTWAEDWPALLLALGVEASP